MIIANGSIEYLIVKGGGLDEEFGHPLPVEEVGSGKPIPCQIVPTKIEQTAKTAEGEPVIRQAWVIYIEQRWRDRMTGERILLRDRKGDELGRYSVISTEPLDAVCEFRIIVQHG